MLPDGLRPFLLPLFTLLPRRRILRSSTRAGTLLRRRCTCAQRVASCRREGFERPRRRMPEGVPMSTEENKAVARRWSEKLWGEGELAGADEIAAPHHAPHGNGREACRGRV